LHVFGRRRNESVRLHGQLEVERCPHCSVDKPTLGARNAFSTTTHSNENERFWMVYVCVRCGGVVTAWAQEKGGVVRKIFPHVTKVEASIPSPAKEYLQQALDTLHSPAGSVMLSASAVEAMLKARGYKAKKDTLNERIDKAAEAHEITPEMKAWAHEIRLDSNEPRHADEEAPLPDDEDARKCVEFALALAELLFVLPARVQRGRGKPNDADQEGSGLVLAEPLSE